jgi:hypothetical protein
MVARIAPSPITTSVAIGDALTHAPVPAAISNGGPSRQNNQTFEQTRQTAQINVAVLPPSPPGEAFAAAVIAGQLPPRPVSPEQLRQRLGSAWQPPASPLRLMDRSI